MRLLHLKDENQDGVTFVTLWGGPVWTDADNIHPDDDDAVDQFCAVRERFLERQGDDGMFWRRKLWFIGLDIYEVRLDEQQRPHIRLYDGSWLVLDCEGTDLADEAYVRGILNLGDRLLPPASSWKALGVKAISIVNELPE